MQSKPQPELIRVWRSDDASQLELRRGIGVSRPVPRHWHEEFQLCFIEAGPSEMWYRGANHDTPPDSLFLVCPGEVHSNHAFAKSGCSYRTMYLSADIVSNITSELTGRHNALPFFRLTIIFEPDIQLLYLQLCRAIETSATSLARDSLLHELFGRLITRHSEAQPSLPAIGRERQAVQRARDYLTDNYARNISLAELAAVANLSPFHLNRVFRNEVGMPPHAFQIQVRVLRARSALRRGSSISTSAAEAGFADQSHLNRHFKRLAVVTPGQFQQGSKNVQDKSESLS